MHTIRENTVNKKNSAKLSTSVLTTVTQMLCTAISFWPFVGHQSIATQSVQHTSVTETNKRRDRYDFSLKITKHKVTA
jgi:hypothetical protein